MLEKLSGWIVKVVDRYLPDPFVFAIIMTFVAALLALLLTDASPELVLTSWGNGLSMLLSFIAQMALMLLFAYAMSKLEPIPTLLNKIAALPNAPWVAYCSATLFTGLVSYFSWPLGLILGALFARALGISARNKGLKLHYPLVVAAAFAGFIVWHMGYSASAPLFVATEGNAMQEQMGGVIPVIDTIFAGWNIAIAIITLLMVAITSALLHPKNSDDIVECQQATYDSGDLEVQRSDQGGLADWVEHSRLPVFCMGLLICAYLMHWFVSKGLVIDLNIVNWSFLAIGLLLAKSSAQYAKAFYSGARTAAPVMLQYPFYGGIMGIMLGTGIIASIVPVFTRIATEHTLPVIAFFLGGLINFFIPSGGAQWAVQGPAFVEAAQELGTELPLVVMGIAYGDQWTNIIHPFTVIIFVIITELKARQIIAYTAVMWLVSTLPLALGLYLASVMG